MVIGGDLANDHELHEPYPEQVGLRHEKELFRGDRVEGTAAMSSAP